MTIVGLVCFIVACCLTQRLSYFTKAVLLLILLDGIGTVVKAGPINLPDISLDQSKHSSIQRLFKRSPLEHGYISLDLKNHGKSILALQAHDKEIELKKQLNISQDTSHVIVHGDVIHVVHPEEHILLPHTSLVPAHDIIHPLIVPVHPHIPHIIHHEDKILNSHLVVPVTHHGVIIEDHHKLLDTHVIVPIAHSDHTILEHHVAPAFVIAHDVTVPVIHVHKESVIQKIPQDHKHPHSHKHHEHKHIEHHKELEKSAHDKLHHHHFRLPIVESLESHVGPYRKVYGGFGVGLHLGGHGAGHGYFVV